MIGEPAPGIGNPNRGETIPQVSEPGIVRNATGRIVATGWPLIPHSLWKISYHELGRNIAEQVKFELKMRGRIDEDRAIPTTYNKHGIVFNLQSTTLRQKLLLQIDAKMDGFDKNNRLLLTSPIEVCDIGGGVGTMLGTVFSDNHIYPKEMVYATLTTLVHHEGDSVEINFGDQIDAVRTIAIELPPKDIYRKFDIITAQNTIFFWSDNPELATTNMWKMLKDGGVALVTIPPVARILDGKFFDTELYLSSSPLFMYEKLGRIDGSSSIALRRKNIDEKELPQLLSAL